MSLFLITWEDEEWAWVNDFQKQTGLTVTLIATTAPAYENNKMYNLAEQARIEGREIRPQAAGRPTGVLHGLLVKLPCICRSSYMA